MPLLLNDNIPKEKWKRLLSQTEYATPFQSHEWYDFHKRVNESSQSPFALALTGIQEEGLSTLCCGLVLQEPGVKSHFSRRAIINGGIVGNSRIDETLDEMLTELNRYMKEKSVIYAEIRNLNNYSSFRPIFEKNGWRYEPHLNFHVDSRDDDRMWERMSSGRRRDIKYGEKKGVTCRLATSYDEVRKWYKILKNLYLTKVKTPLPDENYFLELDALENTRLLVVDYRGEIIGGLLGYILPKVVFCDMFCCGMDDEYKAERIYPSILATWGAMRQAHMENIPRFDFMGAGKPDVPYGVRDFKAKFGGELVQHGRFIKVFSPVRYRLGEIAVKMLKRFH